MRVHAVDNPHREDAASPAAVHRYWRTAECQLRITVMGAESPASDVLIKKRWPSGETS